MTFVNQCRNSVCKFAGIVHDSGAFDLQTIIYVIQTFAETVSMFCLGLPHIHNFMINIEVDEIISPCKLNFCLICEIHIENLPVATITKLIYKVEKLTCLN